MLNVTNDEPDNKPDGKTDESVSELISRIKKQYDEIIAMLKALNDEKTKLETFFPSLKNKKERKDKENEDSAN